MRGVLILPDWPSDALRHKRRSNVMKRLSQEQKEAAAGVMSLFSLMGDTMRIGFANPPIIKETRSKLDILLREKELMGFFLTGHPLDNYRDILKRLSCVPLHMVEEVSKEGVYRCAFIVEAAQVKISAKTQKKFAILTISNGIDRYELPVWSDLYEEKSLLLKENQLLYAVLSVEKKEEEGLRLSCKWLDDLSKADESMIEACDAAFDKAKHQATKFSNYSKSTVKKGNTELKKTPKVEVKNLTEFFQVKIDAANVKLSHILNLKKIFEKHRGTVPVQLEFADKEHAIASVHVNSTWGVTPSIEFQQELQVFLESNNVRVQSK